MNAVNRPRIPEAHAVRSATMTSISLVLLLAGAVPVAVQGQDSSRVKPPTAPASMEGKWRGSMETPGGTMDVYCVIKKDSSGFSGTITSPDGDVPLRDIVVDRDKLTAAATASVQGNAIELSYSFVLKDDTLTGSASVNFNGQSISIPLALKRVADK